MKLIPAACLALLLVAGSPATFAADDAVKAADAAAGTGEGWVQLFNGKDFTGWKFRQKAGSEAWKVVSDVKLDPADPKKLVGNGEGGSDRAVLLRGPIEHGADVYTEKEFGDCELHVEFVVPQRSNSGVYLMGRYEIQVADGYGKADANLRPGDVGGIYITSKPSKNASKPAGEWQAFDVVFQAPRFDAAGKKTQNARFVSVKLNGQEIQKDVEVKGPTGGQISNDEKPTGPLLFQGDHGVVAFRNVRIKPKQQ